MRPHAPLSPPWWTFGHVWLVLAGPALVVIASWVTLYLALSRPEVEVGADSPPARAGVPVSRQASRDGPAAMTPALQARNQAAAQATRALAAPPR